MLTPTDFYAATPPDRLRIARALGWRTHLGTYPGPLYEASRVDARLANRRTPTHKGAAK